MPNIETVKGIKINVNPNDHVPPHIHAIYGGYEALIEIRTSKTLKVFYQNHNCKPREIL
jgi:hypothetical protein